MSFSKVLAYGALILFISVVFLGVVKKSGGERSGTHKSDGGNAPIEIKLYDEPLKQEIPVRKNVTSSQSRPEADRINELFNLGIPKLPIVETVTYTSRVPWKRGAAAWVVDYANHYKTSRHFIARSLNKKVDYDTQNVTNGDKFNVFRLDREVEFHLVVDIMMSKMWFYYHDKSANEKVLLKSYPVGLGKKDASKPSGLLTPLGTYSLGSNIAVYRPGYKGMYNGEKIEMMTVFGSRWIPFEKEISECTEPAKGYGIHGTPWVWNAKTRKMEENRTSIGEYESDGCIRLRTEDVEELFSIVITKPTYIHIVNDFFDADIPGIEQVK